MVGVGVGDGVHARRGAFHRTRGGVDDHAVGQRESVLLEQALQPAVHARLEEGDQRAAAIQVAADRVAGLLSQLALWGDQEQGGGVLGHLLHGGGDEIAHREALGLERGRESGKAGCVGTQEAALARTAGGVDHVRARGAEPLERLPQGALGGPLDRLEAISQRHHHAVRGTDVVAVRLVGGLVQQALAHAGLARAGELGQQDAGASNARVEALVVERERQLLVEARQGVAHGGGEREAPLDGPVELRAAPGGGSLEQHARHAHAEDDDQPGQQRAADGGIAEAAQPARAEDRRNGQRQPARRQIQPPEDSVLARGVVGAQAEGEGDQAHDSELAHAQRTCRRSKEKRAIAKARPAMATK